MKKCKNVGTNHFNDPNAFIECSNVMDNVYQSFDDYNRSRQRETLIKFYDMIVESKKCLLGAENEIFDLFLSLSVIFLFQMMSD